MLIIVRFVGPTKKVQTKFGDTWILVLRQSVHVVTKLPLSCAVQGHVLLTLQQLKLFLSPFCVTSLALLFTQRKHLGIRFCRILCIWYIILQFGVQGFVYNDTAILDSALKCSIYIDTAGGNSMFGGSVCIDTAAGNSGSWRSLQMFYPLPTSLICAIPISSLIFSPRILLTHWGRGFKLFKCTFPGFKL